MARTRIATATRTTTYEGAKATALKGLPALRRAVLSCLLWEDQFYESGVAIAERIRALTVDVLNTRTTDNAIPVTAELFNLARDARSKHHLRHAPLWLVNAMLSKDVNMRPAVSGLIPDVVQRADDMGELMAMYWKDGKHPLAHQLRKGLALAFPKFDAYQLGKYDSDRSQVTPRDVMFLTHPTAGRKGFTRAARKAATAQAVEQGAPRAYMVEPTMSEQEVVWGKLADKALESPDTWEVNLSAGKDKKATFERLMREHKLGALATIRNLRNMVEAKVDKALIRDQLAWIDSRSGILPYQFIAAAKHAPGFESEIEGAMFRSVSGMPKITGKTVLVLDRSGSMAGPLGGKSELTRLDAAGALAILARELCEDVRIYATAGNDSMRIHATELLPARRGFALAEAFKSHQFAPAKVSGSSWDRDMNGGGIFLTQAMAQIRELEDGADNIIVFTDEQDCETDPAKSADKADAFAKRNVIINISSYQHSINWGKWTSINGFSESALEFVRELGDNGNGN